MDRPDRRDHRDVGPRDLGQVRDLAHAAHRQLAHHRLGVGLDPAQRERQADLGVEVGVARDGPQPPAQDGAQDVLGRRLPGRAGHADHPRARAPAHLGRDLAEGDQRVGHDDAALAGGGFTGRAGHEHGRGPGGQRVGGEPGAVGARPRQGDEQVARGDRARVDRDSGDRDGRRGAAAAEVGDLGRGERDHAAGSPASASRATVRSSKGSVRSANCWPCSWPLPGDHDHVARAGQCRRRARSPPGGRARCPSAPRP